MKVDSYTIPSLLYILTDINECTDTSICGVGGTCTNTYASYTCKCVPGYTGGGDATPCSGRFAFVCYL